MASSGDPNATLGFIKGEYLALEAYAELFRRVKDLLLEDPSRRIHIHAMHSTGFELWRPSRGREFLSIQEDIAALPNGTITRLMVGPAPIQFLARKSPTYIPVIRRMIEAGVKVYYTDRLSAAKYELKDFVLINDNGEHSAFRWIPHSDARTIRHAKFTWAQHPDLDRIKRLWTDEVEYNIRSGRVLRLSVREKKLKARREPLREMTQIPPIVQSQP